MTKLKVFAGDKLNVANKMISVFDRGEKPFHTVFAKTIFVGSLVVNGFLDEKGHSHVNSAPRAVTPGLKDYRSIRLTLNNDKILDQHMSLRVELFPKQALFFRCLGRTALQWQ